MNKFDKNKEMNKFDKDILFFLLLWIEFYLMESDSRYLQKKITIDCIHMKLIFYLFEEENIEFFEKIIQKYMHDDFMFLYQYNIILCNMTEKDANDDYFQSIMKESKIKQLEIIENIKKRDLEFLSSEKGI